MGAEIKSFSLLFLDVDGVLNCRESIAHVRRIREKCPCLPGCDPQSEAPLSALTYFAPWSVEALNAVTDQTGAHIVVSSTWREGAVPWLRRWGVRGDILGTTPVLDQKQGLIWTASTRSQEIAAWLRAWSCQPKHPHIHSFVVVDDEPARKSESQTREIDSRWVQISQGTGRGLTFQDVPRIIEMLARPFNGVQGEKDDYG